MLLRRCMHGALLAPFLTLMGAQALWNSRYADCKWGGSLLRVLAQPPRQGECGCRITPHPCTLPRLPCSRFDSRVCPPRRAHKPPRVSVTLAPRSPHPPRYVGTSGRPAGTPARVTRRQRRVGPRVGRDARLSSPLGSQRRRPAAAAARRVAQPPAAGRAVHGTHLAPRADRPATQRGRQDICAGERQGTSWAPLSSANPKGGLSRCCRRRLPAAAPRPHVPHPPPSPLPQGLPQSLQHPVAVAGLFSPFGDVLDVKL